MKAAKPYKKKVRKVAIVVRPDTKAALEAAEKVRGWFADRDIKVFGFAEQKIKTLPSVEDPDDLQMVVVLGGDGTYLAAVRMLEGARVPLLGFNMGSLGFLTFTRAEDLTSTLKAAIDGKMELQSRAMIRVKKGRDKKTYLAPNDVVIERGSNSRLISIKVSVDGMQINSVKADGLIIATPTGSSAYNLAAGGPILHPDANAFVVTPICAHSLTSRPFVLPNDRVIVFSNEEKAVLTVDGVQSASLAAGEKVTVQRDENDHLFLRKSGINFFSIIREKLKFGERA